MLPNWLLKWDPERHQATGLTPRFDSWSFHSRKHLIESSEVPITSLSLIAQYVVGSLAFGAQMEWRMENLTRDDGVTSVFAELLPCTKRGDVWPDDRGRPVVFCLYELTDTAIRWFYAAHAQGHIDPIVRTLLRAPRAVRIPWLGLTRRLHHAALIDRPLSFHRQGHAVPIVAHCTVVQDITVQRPTPSLRELCAFFERVTAPDAIPYGRISLPTSGWRLDVLLDCPPVVAMMRAKYDVVHVDIETPTREVRWLFADNSR